VNRGPRRTLQSITVELTPTERRGTPDPDEFEGFSSYSRVRTERLERPDVEALLVESGLWTALRTRPFAKVPRPGTSPAAVFVTAVDTNPLAPDPDVVLAERRDDFDLGLTALTRLTDGATYLCVKAGSVIGSDLAAPVTIEEFAGPHPAGTAGLHVHLLAPAGRARTVWTIGYQDVFAIGALLRTGRLAVDRVISIAGPALDDPRLVRTRIGASVADFQASERPPVDARWISGSVLSGKAANGDVFGFMGRYDVQLSVLPEGGQREFLAWLAPGLRRFSSLPVFLSGVFRRRTPDFTTDAHGARRPMVPVGAYERVMPLDILPTFLLRALLVGDLDRAEALGCLELTEEDLALCSFVDPSKTDFGPLLRSALDRIEEAG
jgi:Na+-transporting NADH:ubiquinone oxidoreductase subunit A